MGFLSRLRDLLRDRERGEREWVRDRRRRRGEAERLRGVRERERVLERLLRCICRQTGFEQQDEIK
jgi:hypothetical protein